ncbi:MAG TPA: transposase, partial [Polyangiaceae bacterium]|nr:transposase [Polyangiaceae bacterium]
MARPDFTARYPIHVTMRLVNGLPNLRRKQLATLVFSAFREAKAHLGTRVVQFSVQSNHLHVIAETEDRRTLARAMKGLAVRLARRLNRELDRTGRVFSERYHARSLKTPLEVRRALVYVLRNNHKHSSGPG